MVREIKAMLREPLEFNYINYRRMYFYIKHYEEKKRNKLFNSTTNFAVNKKGENMPTNTTENKLIVKFERLYKYIKTDQPWLNESLSKGEIYGGHISASWIMYIYDLLVEKLKTLVPTGEEEIDKIINNGNLHNLTEEQISKLDVLLSIEKDYVR
jgi:hypothetical protein